MSMEVMMSDTDFGNDEVPDLHERLAELRKAGTVVPVRHWGKTAWMVLGREEIVKVFNDSVNFHPEVFQMKYAAPGQGRTMLAMDGQEHRINRTAVQASFLPGKVRPLMEQSIAPAIHHLLDRIEGQEEVEFVQAVARPFPFLVITKLLGIPVEDEALFMHWAVKMIDFPWDPEGAVMAKAEFDEHVQKIIDERRINPADDVLSMMANAVVEGRTLDNEEVLAFARILFPAGSDTTFKSGGSLFAAVLGQPEFRAMALKDEKSRAALVSEALRWEPPVPLQPRMASADSELGGVQIKEGDMLLLALAAVNNDPEKYPDPRRFDPSRDNSSIMTFGNGPHFCLGMHVARRELETALRVVFERFPKMELSPGRQIAFVGGQIRGPREVWVRPYGLT